MDRVTKMMVEAWAEHQKTKPDAPEHYLVNVTHLQIRQDEWEKQDNAWRLLVGIRLANAALRDVS